MAKRLTASTGIPFKRTFASGAHKNVGVGDVTSDSRIPSHRWLLELKNRAKFDSHGEKQITLFLSELEQACNEAVSIGALPALVTQFTNDRNYYATINLKTFERLLAEHREMSAALSALAPEEEA